MIKITSLEVWQKLLERSGEHPFIVLKHSNACGTSAAAYARMEEAEKSGLLSVPLHLVVVQENRDVCDAIALNVGIEHESPQVIGVKNGQAVHWASHDAIDPAKVMEDMA